MTCVSFVNVTSILHPFESVVIHVFLYSLFERSARLTKIDLVAVPAGDLIDTRGLRGVVADWGTVPDELTADCVACTIHNSTVVSLEKSGYMVIGEISMW